MSNYQHVSIGSIVLDWVIDQNGVFHEHVLGGNGLYGAAGARIWVDNVAVVSRIGNDFPEDYLQPFKNVGIDLSGVKVLDRPHGMFSAYRYDANGERTFFKPLEYLESRQITPTEKQRELFGSPDFFTDPPEFDITVNDIPEKFLSSDSYSVHPLPRSVQKDICVHLGNNAMITVDPGWIISKDSLQEAAAFQVLAPSEAEFGLFSAWDDIYSFCEPIWNSGLSAMVVKVGRKGCFVFDIPKRTVFQIPVTVFAPVKDPTGAGDSFCGGFSVAWGKTRDPLEAALYGMVSSSFIIQEFEAKNALHFEREEAYRRLNILRTKVNRL